MSFYRVLQGDVSHPWELWEFREVYITEIIRSIHPIISNLCTRFLSVIFLFTRNIYLVFMSFLAQGS